MKTNELVEEKGQFRKKLYKWKIFKLEAPNTKQNDRTYGVNLSDIREKGYSNFQLAQWYLQVYKN